MQNFQTKLKELWEKIKGFFKKLNKKALILLGICLVVVLAVVIALVLRMNQKEYAVLYTGLTAAETNTVVGFLSDQGMTDYRIQGDTVLVPAGRETQLQADLVMSGYMTTGFNYEFYTNNTGNFSTAAERQEAIRIATEQKLAATIRLFDGVQDATVQITPGTKQVYVIQDSATPATAAVTITPIGNQPLSTGVVKAIRHTVAHSVADLNIGSVSIQDIYGNEYSDNDTITKMSQSSALKMEREQQISNNVRGQILQTLGAVYGLDNVQVSVLSTVEVSHKVIDSTRFNQPAGSVDGGGLVHEDHLYQDVVREPGEGAGGAVGTTTNSDVPIYPDLNSNMTGNESQASNQLDRYHSIDTVKEQEEVLEDRLTGLGVVVMVNQNCDNAGAMTIDGLRDSVATLASITGAEDVNSQVHVSIVPFFDDSPSVPGGPGGIWFLTPENSWILYAAIGGLVLFIILLVVIILLARRRRKKRRAEQEALEQEMLDAQAAAEAAAILAASPPVGGADIMEVNTEKSMELRQEVRKFAQNNPEIAAQMVRAWLKGEESTNG